MTVTPNGFDHDIAWSEFTRVEEAPARSSETAYVQVHRRIRYRWEWTGSEYGAVGVTASISMNTPRSWVEQGTENNRLLAHEQGHYDISAIGTREEATLVAALTAARGREIDESRREIGREIQRKINAADVRYDNETDHYRNRAVQNRWDRAIAAVKNNDAGTLDDLP